MHGQQNIKYDNGYPTEGGEFLDSLDDYVY